MNSKFVCRKIEEFGGVLVRIRGSHRQYKLTNGKTITVPHPRKDVPLGTLRSIGKQSGISL